MATYLELQEQIKELQAQAEKVRKDELQAVISDIKSKISLYSITAKDLGFSDSQKQAVKPESIEPKKKLSAKYRNNETGDEWSGRGNQPKWLKAAIASGKTIDDFLIS
jgi:DNA-binding protein H-NS